MSYISLSALLLGLGALLLSVNASAAFNNSPYDLTLIARGATFPAPLYQNWMLSYATLRGNNISMSYIPTGSGDGLLAITQCLPYCVDFAGSDNPLAETDYVTYASRDLVTLPFVAGAVVPIYNIPELANLGRIVFGRSWIVDLFLGKIKFWNDSRILADQSAEVAAALASVKVPIDFILRTDVSGSTTTFTSALSLFSIEWQSSVGPTSKWDSRFFNGTFLTATSASNGEGVMASISSTTYSLSYSSLGLAKTYGVMYGTMKNKVGNVVDPGLLDLTGVTFNNRFNTDLNDRDGPNTFPIAEFTYIVIQANPVVPDFDCDRRREIFKFFNFVLTNKNMRTQTATLGYTLATSNMITNLLKKLASCNCNGISLTEVYLEDRAVGGTAAILAIAIVIIAFGIISTAATAFGKFGRERSFYNMVENNSRKKLVLLLFALALVLGIIVSAISPIFFAFSPIGTSSNICAGRLWPAMIGLIVIIGAQAGRANQVTIIKSLGLKNKGKSSLLLPFKFVRDIGVMLLVEIVFLLIWQFVQPYHSELILTDALNIAGEWRCLVPSAIFPAIQVCFFLLYVGYGMAQVYRNWKLNAKTTAQMWLLISFYNFLVIFILIVPLSIVFTSDLAFSIIAIAGMLFLLVQSLTTFLVPVWTYYRRIIVESDTEASNNKRTGTSLKITSSQGEPEISSKSKASKANSKHSAASTNSSISSMN